ncbi:MAG: heparan-alpha-glucosaminide N-acetyltransferase domain-containing protein [Candidatus Helarchaeota archaeon]
MTINTTNLKNSTKIKKERIESIDILKGISIFWIVGGHISASWLLSTDIWMYEMLYVFFLSTVGPANFIMLSGLNLAISFNSKKDAGWNLHKIHIYTLKRIGVLFIISVVYNYFMAFVVGGYMGVNWFDFFSWYILQVICVSLIITIYILQINKIYRIILSFLIIFGGYPLHLWLCSLGVGGTIADHILYYPFPSIFWAFPLLPWSACAFIGSIIGEYFYKIKYNSDNENGLEKMKKFIIYLCFFGISFITIAVLFGASSPTDPNSLWYQIAQHHVSELNTAWFFNFSSLPYFILPNHWTYLFYALGADFIMLAVLAYYSDYLKRSNKIFNSFSFTGKIAFSVFIYHHFGILLFPNTFNYILVWPAWVGFAILIIFLLWILVKKFNGVGTIEWFMVVVTKKKSNTT